MTNKFPPRQAVILCGGLGTRLRPLTDSLPKPMVIVNDRPFLHHLLDQLALQGISKFILLVGYLGEQISKYFGDGSQYGWSINYSVGPAEWDTGRRVWEARVQLDVQFLLLYSDNFVQFDLAKLLKLHQKLKTPISLLLAPKSKGNISVLDDGLVQAYDKTRNAIGFNFVEVGYMVVQRDGILKEFPSYPNFPNFSFSDVLKKLAKQQRIAGLVVRDAYHSISEPKRLALMREYLRPKKILLIDRDGTINAKATRGEYISNWREFSWIPETLKAMIHLAKQGFKFIVITNQAGISRKMITPEALDDIHVNMISELKGLGIEVLKVYMCPDHWNDGSFMRKPAPGMFFQAATEFNLRMDNCLYVGDDERDCSAAANAGCGMVYLTDDEKPPQLKEIPKPLFVAKTLPEAVAHITETYEKWESRL